MPLPRSVCGFWGRVPRLAIKCSHCNGYLRVKSGSRKKSWKFQTIVCDSCSRIYAFRFVKRGAVKLLHEVTIPSGVPKK